MELERVSDEPGVRYCVGYASIKAIKLASSEKADIDICEYMAISLGMNSSNSGEIENQVIIVNPNSSNSRKSRGKDKEVSK